MLQLHSESDANAVQSKSEMAYLLLLLCGELTVPLKSKLPVSSRFSRDENLVSRDENLVSRDESLVSRYEGLVSRESLKRKFWNITEFLARRTYD